MDNSQLDIKVRNFFNNRTIQPSSSAWDRIDTTLDMKHRPRPIWSANIRKVAAIVLFFCILGGVTYVLDTKYPEDKHLTVKNNSNQSEDKPVIKVNHHLLLDGSNEGNRKLPKTIAEYKSNTVTSVNQYVNHNNHNKSTNQSDYSSMSVVLTSENLKEPVILEEENEKNRSFESSAIKNMYRISSAVLLSSVESDIAKAKKLTTHNEIIKKYHIYPSKLLKDAEEKAAQSFMAKVWKNIQDKSEVVITSVIERNEVK